MLNKYRVREKKKKYRSKINRIPSRVSMQFKVINQQLEICYIIISFIIVRISYDCLQIM